MNTFNQERILKMKHIKKIVGMILAMIMIMALSATAFAQNVDSGKGGAATITVSNASKGETGNFLRL